MPEPVTVPPAPPPGTFEAVPTTSAPLPTSTTSAHDLLGLVLAHAELRPDSPALQDDHGRFTYGELARHVANLASGLSALGVGAGAAGLECARVLALQGHRVRVVERGDRPGGALRAAAVGPGRGRLVRGRLRSRARLGARGPRARSGRSRRPQ